MGAKLNWGLVIQRNGLVNSLLKNITLVAIEWLKSGVQKLQTELEIRLEMFVKRNWLDINFCNSGNND